MSKFINVLVAIVTGIILTIVLRHYLLGTRGAPWFNFYAFEMVLTWGLVVFACVLMLSQEVLADTVIRIGDWIREGGFWAIWRRNHVPGNTWLVISFVFIWNAISYGPPTPQIDWVKVEYQIATSASEVSSHLEDTQIASGIKDSINYLAKGFIGREVIDTSIRKNEPTVANLLPRYKKGWWRIWLALLAIIFAPLVWVWGRRDIMSDTVSFFSDHLRSSASSNTATTVSVADMRDEVMEKILKQTSRATQITTHLIGEWLVRCIDVAFNHVIKFFKRS